MKITEDFLKSLKVEEWVPDTGYLGDYVGMDTETTFGDFGIADSWENVGNFALIITTVYAGGDTKYWVKNENVEAFLKTHQKPECRHLFANFQFDFFVIKHYLQAGVPFYKWAERVHDVQILHRLLSIARTGSDANRYSLAVLAKQYCGHEMDKSDDLRLNFGDYLRDDGTVDYEALTENKARLSYALDDAVVTYFIFESIMKRIEKLGIQKNEHGWMTDKIQTKASVALRVITLNGINLDGERATRYRDLIQGEADKALDRLNEWAYQPGKGSGARLQEIMSSIIAEHNVPDEEVLKTKTGKISTAGDFMIGLADKIDNPFLNIYSRYKKLSKLLTTYYSKCFHPETGKAFDRMHPRYNYLVNTGRTSARGGGPYSQSLNIQNLPRDGVTVDGEYLDFRSLFLPDDGEVIADADYSALELATLAQHCYVRQGYSELRNTLMSGHCPHKITAASIYGIDVDQVTKGQRQLAKAANFGFPGGCSAKTFVAYAQGYGCDITVEEAEVVKEKFFEAYPEIKAHLSKDPAVPLQIYEDFQLGTSLWYQQNPEIAVALFLRILGGETSSTKGRPYNDSTIDWAWNRVGQHKERFSKKLQENIETRTGDLKLKMKIGSIWKDTNLSNRPRGHMSYTTKSNYGFQGLAGDGAKEAGFDLILRGGDGSGGFKAIAFVHDQYLITHPLQNRMKYVNILEGSMVSQMKRFTPDVPISVETALSNRFSKSAEPIWNEDETELQVFEVS